MSEIDRIYYAVRKIENKSVATMSFGDWSRLVRQDGEITELEELPAAINHPSLAASTIVSYASGVAITEPGIDVFRYHEKDAPYVINVDHYTVIENLHLHDIYPDALKVANLPDTSELRWELQNNIYVVKEPPNDNHWMKEFPKFVLEAKRKT